MIDKDTAKILKKVKKQKFISIKDLHRDFPSYDESFFIKTISEISNVYKEKNYIYVLEESELALTYKRDLNQYINDLSNATVTVTAEGREKLQEYQSMKIKFWAPTLISILALITSVISLFIKVGG